MTEALITPELLRWAVERSRLSIDTIAKKAHIKPEQLILWEEGNAWPKFNQARNLAKALHVPFGYLFLSSPPEEKPALPDLRTVRDDYPSFSPDFLELLSAVLIKQQWYKEYLQEELTEPLGCIGRFNLNAKVEHVAEDIAKTLAIDKKFRQQATSWDDFLRKAIHQAEDIGILVLRSGIVGNQTRRKLSVQEFRGFAICDDLAPLIFLNGCDAKAAQIFTLAHELAHLWIGESGISNSDIGKPTPNHKQQIESFCNSVAAELLVPKTQFLNDWQQNIPIQENLNTLVRRYRVSSVVILRRAYDLKKITTDNFFTYYKHEISKHKPKAKSKSGGNFYATLMARNSLPLTHTVVSAAFEGRLLYRDAARFLDVKVKTLDNIAYKLGIR